MDAVPPKICDMLKKLVDNDIGNVTVSVCDSNGNATGSGLIFRVSVQDKNNGKELHFVLKQALSGEIRDLFPIRDVFLNEVYFYTSMWPNFLKFQEKIAPSCRFVHLPECLATMIEDGFESLVLEDLSYQGFVNHDKKKALEKDQFENIFKMYGKFHAMSCAYKALKPLEFSELTKGLSDLSNIFLENKLLQYRIKLVHRQCLDIFHNGVDDTVIEKYKHYIHDGVELFQKSLTNYKYPFIVHGDCWSNNMMFKYDNSGNIIDFRLLDFQNVRTGCAVGDLSYCLYSGGTKEIFDGLDGLLEVYHDSFSESLRAYGCDPNELYSLDALKNDWKVHSQYGLTMGLMVWKAKLAYYDGSVDVCYVSDDQGDTIKCLEAKFDRKAFSQRARDIISHFHERNYLL